MWFWYHSNTPYQLSLIFKKKLCVLLNLPRPGFFLIDHCQKKWMGRGGGPHPMMRPSVLISLLWYWIGLMVVQHFDLWKTPVVLVIATKETFMLPPLAHIYTCIYMDWWVNNSLAKNCLFRMLNQLLIEIGCGIQKCISV